MINKKYKQYLKSKEWDKKRKSTLKRDNYTCQKCGSKSKKLEVHHSTYDRIYKEIPKDLISLCVDCHKREHNISAKDEYKLHYVVALIIIAILLWNI